MDPTQDDPAGDALSRELEPLAYAAWPAAVVEEHGGWRLRFNHGVTNRGNSVWPCALEGDAPLARRLDEAEAFYARRGQPARFQVTPLAQPAGLDDALAARGYERYAPVELQVAEISELRGAELPDGLEVECVETLGEEWFELSGRRGRFEGSAVPVYRELLERMPAPRGFALARRGGVPAAVGIGVAQGSWAGIFSMLTLPEHRGQGLARAVLGGLARWAAGTGAHRLYLQVEEDNGPARTLYAGAGFATAYRYHYRRQRLRE